MNDHTVIAIKAGGEWVLDVLGVPFGDASRRDFDGEWFDADTKLHLDKFGLPAIAYYHGRDDTGRLAERPEYIGKAVEAETKSDGVWFRVVLDQANALAQRIWDAAQRGMARASSGTIEHLMRKDSNGHILEWPVAELSLLELGSGKRPANNYAVAVPVLKALGIELAEADAPAAEAAEPEPEPATDESQPAAETPAVDIAVTPEDEDEAATVEAEEPAPEAQSAEPTPEPEDDLSQLVEVLGEFTDAIRERIERMRR